MTHKQTDYDKAFEKVVDYVNANNTPDMRLSTRQDIIEYAFYQGYKHGKQCSAADHVRNLIALGDDYMTAMTEAREESYNKWLDSDADYDTLDAYRQGWNDADAFEGRWINKHPENLLNRLLNEFPEIIEDEVRARMADIRKEAKENENAFAFASDNISQNIANYDIHSDKSLMRYEIAMRAMEGQLISSDIGDAEELAFNSVAYADALIKELERREEP